MDSSLRKLNNIIEYLKDQSTSTDNLKLSEERLRSLINELNVERSLFLKEKLPELKTKIKKNQSKVKISALSLMEYDFHENSHSNILAYLINYNLYKEGAKILSQLVKDSFCDDKEELSKRILKKRYSVYREFSIPSGRIDLLILDEVEKFVIIIENKILADVETKEIKEDENEDLVTVNQLQRYEKWCRSKYPDYFRSYILLNLSSTELNLSLFSKVSYNDLLHNLKRQKFRDNIVQDYLLLLDSLTNAVSTDLFHLKVLVNKLMENDEPKLSLVEYYTLKTIFYAS